MYRETTGPVINLRSELDEVRLKAAFGEEVRLTRDVWVDDSLHYFISRADYYYLFEAGDPVWHLTFSEPLPNRDEVTSRPLWQMPDELLTRHPLLDEVVTGLRLLKPQGVWLPLVWAALWSDEGKLLASNISSLGERWEACEHYVPGEAAREEMEAWADVREPGVERYQLEARDVPDVQNVLDGLSRRPLDRRDGERSRIDMGISRFNMALERPRAVDRVIDLSVALEALFMNPRENDIASHVSNRSAKYLEDSFQSISKLSEQVKHWYYIRSRIVHGEEPPRDLSRVVSGLTAITRRSLRKALAEPASLTQAREYLRRSPN